MRPPITSPPSATPRFPVGSAVWCRWELKKEYAAKVTDFDARKGEFSYRVHYVGWNDRHDEWVAATQLRPMRASVAAAHSITPMKAHHAPARYSPTTTAEATPTPKSAAKRTKRKMSPPSDGTAAAAAPIAPPPAKRSKPTPGYATPVTLPPLDVSESQASPAEDESPTPSGRRPTKSAHKYSPPPKANIARRGRPPKTASAGGKVSKSRVSTGHHASSHTPSPAPANHPSYYSRAPVEVRGQPTASSRGRRPKNTGSRDGHGGGRGGSSNDWDDEGTELEDTHPPGMRSPTSEMIRLAHSLLEDYDRSGKLVNREIIARNDYVNRTVAEFKHAEDRLRRRRAKEQRHRMESVRLDNVEAQAMLEQYLGVPATSKVNHAAAPAPSDDWSGIVLEPWGSPSKRGDASGKGDAKKDGSRLALPFALPENWDVALEDIVQAASRLDKASPQDVVDDPSPFATPPTSSTTPSSSTAVPGIAITASPSSALVPMQPPPANASPSGPPPMDPTQTPPHSAGALALATPGFGNVPQLPPVVSPSMRMAPAQRPIATSRAAMHTRLPPLKTTTQLAAQIFGGNGGLRPPPPKDPVPPLAPPQQVGIVPKERSRTSMPRPPPLDPTPAATTVTPESELPPEEPRVSHPAATVDAVSPASPPSETAPQQLDGKPASVEGPPPLLAEQPLPPLAIPTSSVGTPSSASTTPSASTPQERKSTLPQLVPTTTASAPPAQANRSVGGMASKASVAGGGAALKGQPVIVVQRRGVSGGIAMPAQQHQRPNTNLHMKMAYQHIQFTDGSAERAKLLLQQERQKKATAPPSRVALPPVRAGAVKKTPSSFLYQPTSSSLNPSVNVGLPSTYPTNPVGRLAPMSNRSRTGQQSMGGQRVVYDDGMQQYGNRGGGNIDWRYQQQQPQQQWVVPRGTQQQPRFVQQQPLDDEELFVGDVVAEEVVVSSNDSPSPPRGEAHEQPGPSSGRSSMQYDGEAGDHSYGSPRPAGFRGYTVNADPIPRQLPRVVNSITQRRLNNSGVGYAQYPPTMSTNLATGIQRVYPRTGGVSMNGSKILFRPASTTNTGRFPPTSTASAAPKGIHIGSGASRPAQGSAASSSTAPTATTSSAPIDANAATRAASGDAEPVRTRLVYAKRPEQ